MPLPDFSASGVQAAASANNPVTEETAYGYPMPGAPKTPIKSKFPRVNIPAPGPSADRKLNPIEEALEKQRQKEEEDRVAKLREETDYYNSIGQLPPGKAPAFPMDKLTDNPLLVPSNMAAQGPSIGVSSGAPTQVQSRAKAPNISSPSGETKAASPAAAPAAKEDDFWSNIAKFLGSAGSMALGGLGKVAEGASRGMSAAGGTIEQNPYFVANAQQFAKEQQQRELEQQSKLQKSEQEYLTGKYLPTQTQQALKLYGGNLQEYLRQFPYLRNLLGSLSSGAGGGLAGGIQSSTDALADSLAAGDFSQLLNPGATKNLQYDPAAAQALEMEKLRMAMGLVPSPPSR